MISIPPTVFHCICNISYRLYQMLLDGTALLVKRNEQCQQSHDDIDISQGSITSERVPLNSCNKHISVAGPVPEL